MLAGMKGLGAPGDSAAIATVSGPSSVLPGQPVNILIQMQNTGPLVWDGTQGYKLGDGQGGPYRMGMVPTIVRPGEVASFQVSFIAPTTTGNYNANYQMLQEGVNWFGPIANLNYSVVPIPPVATPIIVSPSNPSVANAANLTTASGDTSATSSASLNANVAANTNLSVSSLLSGGVAIGGYTIPTVLLIGGGLFLFMTMGSGRGR